MMVQEQATQAVQSVRTAAEAEELIVKHLPLVGHLVREVLARVPVHVRREELMSAGNLALVAAAKSFDDSRGAPFAAFAVVRVRGALMDELRGQDWASRSVRVKARKMNAVQDEFVSKHGRTPTTAEIAGIMEVETREVTAVQDDVQRSALLSLQGFTGGVLEEVVPERQPGPEETLLGRERIGYLHSAIDALPDRLRTVVRGYFFEERPMAEIAEELGVHESRVSQLRAEAIALLRDGLNSQLDPERLPEPARPDGCAARRKAAYYASVAAQGTMRSRLSHTSSLGVPVIAKTA
ncbi:MULTISPECIES: sigma-70 family RNA polymerase sigma factor [Actinosynnema]|uniref:RNA polymerase, sigma 28 subunit, FliA/WhiG subfamily n=2 Tax=Actinosynnema TaxID=40566 RepID=C6WJS0_ACTMD|nr:MULTISPECIES: sigma-70 family RNA polymerase sigma factor [Actinosynnema]ACU36295.1 RNA polymerase, sigma 28 subunit, FliA/WhiG subfamily [Actinosynnema mirum DSM 43827]MCP2099537.1 RNA polymerase, sigma 28 subunit, SigD/FliA/WhiG [Actinosynnema pretiosum]